MVHLIKFLMNNFLKSEVVELVNTMISLSNKLLHIINLVL